MVKALSVEESYKYLGMQVGARGTRKDFTKSLQDSLGNLTRAPLKPQQRMFLLRVYLVPRMYHGLVLAEQTASTLEALDRLVRRSVRAWLRLPPDTPLGFFHADAAEGGLQIPRLRLTIPAMRLKRLHQVIQSTDPSVLAAVGKACFVIQLRRCEKKLRVSGVQLSKPSDVRKALAARLHASVDGRGLQWANEVPAAHRWVTDGTSLLSGADYIQAVKVRGNLLPTRMRSGRGRGRSDVTTCDAGCNARETLSHISQSCARTHLLRTARHDNILGFIEETCRENLHDFEREPTIPTSQGVRRPDLIVKIGECAHVVDLTISSDHVHLSTPYQAKVRYYDQADIRQWVLRRFGCTSVAFGAIVYSWRGCTLPKSVAMLDTIGMPRYMQIIPIIRVLTYTANMYRLFTRSTTRHG